MMFRRILKRRPAAPEIPTASTADVAFLLILFFMVTTIFRATALNLQIVIPKARSTERILIRRNVTHVWVDAGGKVYIDDNVIPADMISAKMTAKVGENPELVTILNIDEQINYGVVDIVLDQLKQARAFKITFATEFPGD